MKDKFYLVAYIISWVISIGSFITTMVFQMVLSVEKYGVIINSDVITIPHWSLVFIGSGILFGVIGYLFGRKL